MADAVSPGDLITPDGDRVWAVADAQQGLTCWPLRDYITGKRQPSKHIPNDPARFAALISVNSNPAVRDQFISDYLARADRQTYRIGTNGGDASPDWVGRKVYPYGAIRSTEHIIRDFNPYLRLLILDPVRAGNPSHYKAVDAWEVTASWHDPHGFVAHPMPSVSNRGGQFLYRLYDQDERLLYVGITDNVLRRWREHSRDKPWWSEVHKFTQHWYPSRTSVESAEREAIKAERPAHNIAHCNRATGTGN